MEDLVLFNTFFFKVRIIIIKLSLKVQEGKDHDQLLFDLQKAWQLEINSMSNITKLWVATSFHKNQCVLTSLIIVRIS